MKIKAIIVFPIVIVLLLIILLISTGNKCNVDLLYSENIETLRNALTSCQYTDKQINPTCEGGLCNPLIIAAHDDSTERVKLLVSAGANPNISGGGATGDTPLIISLINGNFEMTKYLVEVGADVNKPNNFGATPFWGACKMGNIEVIELFLQNGADANKSGRFPDPLQKHKGIVTGITPLMLAVHANNIELVNILINNNANIIAQDSLGRTAESYTEKKVILELIKKST